MFFCTYGSSGSRIFATDYSSMGLLMILFCYCFYNENLKRDISLAAVNVLLMGGRQMFAVLSLIPLHLYSGEKGRDMKKSLSVLSAASCASGGNPVVDQTVTTKRKETQ